MSKREFKRPDTAAMEQLLQDCRGTLAEVVLRLAWNLGLSREEMVRLTWDMVDLSEPALRLPERTVPMEEPEQLCLSRWAETHGGAFVLQSGRSRGAMAPQSVSRLAREALNRGGLPEITLVDLRQDSVIRLLERYDWPYVARVSGTSVTTLYANYSAWYAHGRGVKPPPKPGRAPTPPSDEALRALIETEGDSAEGLALALVSEAGLRMPELLALTWAQVDLDRGLLAGHDTPLSPGLTARLRRVREGRGPEADPHVLLTPRSLRPYTDARLSRTLRSALIRGGLEDVSFRDLVPDPRRRGEDETIIEYVSLQGSATRNQIMEQMGYRKDQSWYRLRSLVEQGRLVRVGMKYFLPGTVTPPEDQYEVLRAYLEEVGTSFRAELAEALGLEGRQCAAVLRRLVGEGKLVQKGQLYALPKEEKQG